MKRWIAIMIVTTFAIVWTLTAYALPPVGIMVTFFCLIFVVFDVGMNGWRYAEFAPINLTIAALGWVGAMAGSP